MCVCVCVCVQPLSCSPGGISVSSLSLKVTFYMHVSIHLSMQLDRRETVMHTQCPVGGGGQSVGDSCFHVAYKLWNILYV